MSEIMKVMTFFFKESAYLSNYDKTLTIIMGKTDSHVLFLKNVEGDKDWKINC